MYRDIAFVNPYFKNIKLTIKDTALQNVVPNTMQSIKSFRVNICMSTYKKKIRWILFSKIDVAHNVRIKSLFKSRIS